MNKAFKISYYFIIIMYSASFSAPSFADIYGSLNEDGYLQFSFNDNKKYDQLIKDISEESGVEPNLIKAIIKVESNFDYTAVSRKGAKGLMQLMPDTASAMEVEDPFNPEENIIGGIRYICMLLDRFNKNKILALAAYNAGPDIVETYQDIPPYKETINFVQRVIEEYQKYSSMD